MAFILPKGFVKNDANIGESIEHYALEPLDIADIVKFWKVYTTTKRRLLDPTAERLENYWWRIWGSQRRELNGAIVGKLFLDISDGQSFTPLRGPANRDEGTQPLNRITRDGPRTSSATTIHRPNQSRPSTTSSSINSKAQVVMPHPILKKTRGPSTTGPRPTARFVSPHESADEVEPASSFSSNSHVIVQSPSPESQTVRAERKATGGVKKKSQNFVASTAGRKKRPVMMRRQSSQSSAESAAKAETSYSTDSYEKSPTSSEAGHTKITTSKFQENFSPDQAPQPLKKQQSGKSQGSRPDLPRKQTRKRFELGQESAEEAAVSSGPSAGTLLSTERDQPHIQDLTPERADGVKEQRSLLKGANTSVQNTPEKTTESSSRKDKNAEQNVQSNSNSQQSHDKGKPRYVPHDRKSSPSLAPTLTAAIGQTGLRDTAGNVPLESSGSMEKGKGKANDSEEVATSSMFARRAVPPAPGTSTAASLPENPLAKSKSQLTLLLEKDRSRDTEYRPKENKRKK